MTKVINFKEMAMFSEINAKTVEEVLKAFKSETWYEVATKINREIIKHQEATYEVFKASLREEAADGIIPPKNGGSSQTGGEHGAGEEDRCGMKTGQKFNIRNGLQEKVIVACKHIINGNKCKKNNKECVFTRY